MIHDDKSDPFNKRNYYKGQHGASVVRGRGNYAVQLKEKQVVRYHYGLEEKQFANSFAKAKKLKGNVLDNFAQFLELRLDTIVYRSNFAPSIFFAKQVVSHGKVLVNGKKVNIKSYKCNVGDVISFTKDFTENAIALVSISQSSRQIPDYISVNSQDFQIQVLRNPVFDEIPFPSKIRGNFIVEYYSRRL